MYVAHNAFYLACILRGCDMSTGFFIRIYERYERSSLTTMQNLVVASHNVCAHVGALRDLWER